MKPTSLYCAARIADDRWLSTSGMCRAISATNGTERSRPWEPNTRSVNKKIHTFHAVFRAICHRSYSEREAVCPSHTLISYLLMFPLILSSHQRLVFQVDFSFQRFVLKFAGFLHALNLIFILSTQ